jgi:8-oxo-dGTP pyrophosphatase MutT (NUDIX family)
MRQQFVCVYATPGHLKSRRHKLVMLTNKNRTDYLANVQHLPGGKVEPGETVLEAAERELYEETGLTTISPPELYGEVRGERSQIHHVVVDVRYEEHLAPTEGETTDPIWVDLPDVIHNPRIMPNLRVTMPLIWWGRKGWTVHDLGDWRTRSHTVVLEDGGVRSEVRIAGWEHKEGVV